ncbi:unnamed protein product [Vitrella brassicaformis CCMP3155]|uniref:GH18 domain-containing protein n=1 Tax=Vitrella brassicaformis (strain CCMP3155) TaxID=1169540 RepID=A0A0G4FUR0_VITBC|nr:unnamed protein product [Vitrella brassicaformis CCMP3155]|eukprot:CEM18690.1 unnamed protein product [Vitrella brassicaformis CCMP3155]
MGQTRNGSGNRGSNPRLRDGGLVGANLGPLSLALSPDPFKNTAIMWLVVLCSSLVALLLLPEGPALSAAMTPTEPIPRRGELEVTAEGGFVDVSPLLNRQLLLRKTHGAVGRRAMAEPANATADEHGNDTHDEPDATLANATDTGIGEPYAEPNATEPTEAAAANTTAPPAPLNASEAIATPPPAAVVAANATEPPVPLVASIGNESEMTTTKAPAQPQPASPAWCASIHPSVDDSWCMRNGCEDPPAGRKYCRKVSDTNAAEIRQLAAKGAAARAKAVAEPGGASFETSNAPPSTEEEAVGTAQNVSAEVGNASASRGARPEGEQGQQQQQQQPWDCVSSSKDVSDHFCQTMNGCVSYPDVCKYVAASERASTVVPIIQPAAEAAPSAETRPLASQAPPAAAPPPEGPLGNEQQQNPPQTVPGINETIDVVTTTAVPTEVALAAKEGGDQSPLGLGPIKRLAIYYANWRSDVSPCDLHLEKVSHILYAYADLYTDLNDKCHVASTNADADFNRDIKCTNDTQPADLQGIRGNLGAFQAMKARHPQLKILMTVGGYTLSRHFSTCMSTPENRAAVINSTVELIRRADLDGMNFEWLFPGGGGDTHIPSSPDDWVNYITFLKELRQTFNANQDNKHLDISITAGVAPLEVRNNTPISELCAGSFLDFISLLTYDLHGPWDNITDYDSPLHADPDDPTVGKELLTVEDVVQHYIAFGCDGEMINVGLPLYGRVYSGVQQGPDKDGLYQPFLAAGNGTRQQEPGILAYWDIAANYMPSTSGFTRHYNNKTRVPYLYKPPSSPNDTLGGTFVAYDDDHSLKDKLALAVEHGVEGLTLWEASDDRDKVLLDAIVVYLESDEVPKKRKRKGFFDGLVDRIMRTLGLRF